MPYEYAKGEPVSINDQFALQEQQRKRGLRAQSFRLFFKRKWRRPNAGKCQCGRTISANKRHCAACTPASRG